MNDSEDSIVTLTTEESNCVCKQVTEVSDEIKEKVQLQNGFANKCLMFKPNLCITSYVVKVKILNLSCCNLKTVDSSLSLLTNLRELDLSSNELSKLPDSFIALKKLFSLNLSHNRFEQVPNFVMKLLFLINLDLSHNRIEYFDEPPNCLGFLKRLNLSYLKIESLPKWLFTDSRVVLEALDLSYNLCFSKPINADSLYAFQHSSSQFSRSLKKLDLSNCSVGLKNVEVVSYFNNIQHLNIGNSQGVSKRGSRYENALWDIPSAVLSNKNICGGLVSLNISNARVSTLSEDIYLLSSLKTFNVSYNELNWLPNSFVRLANLEYCNLANNRISMLPLDFSNLTQLKTLFIGHNLLEDFPKKFENLVNLEFADFYDNSLEEFPIDAIKSLSSNNLRGIDLAWNRCDLPNEDSGLDYGKLQETFRLEFVTEEIRQNIRQPVVEEVSDYSDDESDKSISYFDENDPTSNFESNVNLDVEEVWDDGDDFDDRFDPMVPNLGSRSSSIRSIPLATTPPIGYFYVDDIGPLHYPYERMAFCPADSHPPSIRPTRRPPPVQNYLLTSEQFEDS